MRSSASEYDLVVAKTLAETLELLAAGEGWRPMAGGTDLMVLFNAGKLPYRKLVSIRQVAELRNIEVSDSEVTLGAGVTYSEIRTSETLRSEFPLVCQAASWTGGTANQNRGTIGGNIANASPAADSAPMLLAYDADVEVTASGGRRWLPYAEFHLGYKQMKLQRDELITRIRLPRSSQEFFQYARKVGTRKAQAISKVCFAARCLRREDGLQSVRIAVGSVAPVPLRCYRTERVLEENGLTSDTIARAKTTLASEIRPISDIRSTDNYRGQVTVNLLGEFLDGVR